MGGSTGGQGEAPMRWRQSWMLVAPTSTLVVVDAWRWRWFIHPDVAIARRAANILMSADGLHVYAQAPLAQMGPLAIALIRMPHAVYNVAVAALVLPFLLMAARPLLTGEGASRRITWMIATTLLIAPWAQLAWKGHADDALVLVGAAAMLTGLAIKRPRWLVAGWVLAVAGKPTALALAPLLLASPSSLWVSVIFTVAMWGPFLSVDPGAMMRAGQGVMAVVPGDALAYLGVAHGRPPAWVRPLQLLISWIGTGIGHLRARPAAGLLGALAARAVLEPNPAPAYSIALVAIALFVDAGRRLPLTTVVAAAGFWTSQMVLDGGSGVPRLTFLLALVLWCGWIISGKALDLAGLWSQVPSVRVVRASAVLVAGGMWVATFAVSAEASPVLQRGSVGTGVRCVQWGVNHLSSAALTFGPQTPVDGQYGPGTSGAVQQFQAQYATQESGGRTVDGRVGTLTGSVLLEAGFGGAPAAWHCADHVPHDPKLRGAAQRNLVLIRREIATMTPTRLTTRASAATQPTQATAPMSW